MKLLQRIWNYIKVEWSRDDMGRTPEEAKQFKENFTRDFRFYRKHGRIPNKLDRELE